MTSVRAFLARIPVAKSRSARLMLLMATAFVVAAITLARLPQHDSRAAAAPTPTSGTTSAQAPSSAATQAPASPTGDPFGNEGAVASASDQQAPAGSLNGGRFTMPLASWTKVTDRFGAPRGGGLVHGGIDLALDHHTPVQSACKGTVIFTGYNGTYGNHVIIDCGDGFTTLYGHLSSILVTKDQAVDNTVTIGLSGSTGFSTGEHLHFEIRLNDTPVNPENYLDFHIAPGTPLSDGPIWFPSDPTDVPAPSAAPPTETPVPPTATPTNTPTPTPTFTPTPTPTPKSVRKAPTPPPVSQH